MADMPFDLFEIIYADAMKRFGMVFDADLYDCGLDLARMENDCRKVYAELERDYLEDERFEQVEAIHIIDAIREGASDIDVPTDWQEH